MFRKVCGETRMKKADVDSKNLGDRQTQLEHQADEGKGQRARFHQRMLDKGRGIQRRTRTRLEEAICAGLKKLLSSGTPSSTQLF